MLLDDQGRILTHTRPELVLQPATALANALTPAFLADLARSGARADTMIDGAEQLLYVAPVTGTPWMLAVAMDKAQATAPIRQLIKIAIVIAVLCAAAAAAAVLLQIRAAAENVRVATTEIALGNQGLVLAHRTAGPRAGRSGGGLQAAALLPDPAALNPRHASPHRLHLRNRAVCGTANPIPSRSADWPLGATAHPWYTSPDDTMSPLRHSGGEARLAPTSAGVGEALRPALSVSLIRRDSRARRKTFWVHFSFIYSNSRSHCHVP
ncbi:Uncharacterised protein [uncultured Comamonas sp.]|nr:Uncharacterised protein [uncultured Comamonas sp.]